MALLRKMTCNLRHPMGLRHTVEYYWSITRGWLKSLSLSSEKMRWQDSFLRDMTDSWPDRLFMGWLRLVGSLKSYVSFAKESYKKRRNLCDMTDLWLNRLTTDLFWSLIITSIAVGGWLRWVGSIKLQVSFAEYSLFYRALLQKRPIVLWILLTVATP